MDVETPCLLVDVEILNNNIKRMADLAKKNNVSLRPHFKTHKSVEIAHMQLKAGAQGLTVAKISEAEIMVQAGLKDIFIAYPVIGSKKIARLLELNKNSRIIVGVDSLLGAQALAKAAYEAGQCIEIRLEIDIGFARTGVLQTHAVELAKKINKIRGLKMTGIYVFKAMTLYGKPTLDRKNAGLEEGKLAVSLAEQIRQANIDIRDVSVGSTPTAEFAASVPGVTEIRPGTYVFNDIATIKSGFCTINDCAAKVVVTIVSQSCGNRIVIDGGSKTFSTDIPPGIKPACLEGFGQILTDKHLVFERLSEEHGMIRVKEGAREYKIGEQLSIVPNHICTTVNLHDKLLFVKDSIIVKVIPIDARGCIT